MNTKDIFNITEEQADDVDELKATFENKADLRAALEDYFHVYDDFAEMSEDDFDKAFTEYTKETIESSVIGDIKDQFALGKIKEEEAMNKLTQNGKGKREAKKIIEKWKQNGVVTSSVDSVVGELEDYFGTEAGEDNVIECDDIITHKDVTEINELIEDDDDVKVKVGLYTVTVDEAPESIESAVDLSVEEDEDNVTVSIEKPEDDNVLEGDLDEDDEENSPSDTSFVQINSEEDYDEYNVHLPEDYGFEDVKGMWWEIDGDDGVSMRDVIQQSGDEEVFIVIDNDRVFFDTAYNYIMDADADFEDYGFEEKDFEEGKYIGE